ncbi:hypothetical protein ACF08N_10535 [Streptomyces sp. NPDC015127]|uniref:hypothetical protein n=1 Tax=Streptomyces sp. NPDC015127 TaxID=3364939 RepID=UPI0036FF6221
MADRISALISLFGVLVSSMMLFGAVRDYQVGSSVRWVAAGAVLVLVACLTLVRDIRRLRTAATEARKP